MNDLPDLTKYGYQIDRQLGCNREGGRITWQGINLVSQTTVVVKQFCFATVNANWSGYKAYEREISILKQLKHYGIPSYLDSIETENGFCLIQEYIAATEIGDRHKLTTIELREIFLKILDILIYLQEQKPPIVHRDLKPENILLDSELNPYIIDFGFASLGSKEVSGSSVFQGTPGFIAPEQIIKPTLASDIYSLGITFVCLLSHKTIGEIRDFASTDDPYQLNLKVLFPQLNRSLFDWLVKMTNAKASQRFDNARTARNALLAVDLENNGKLATLDSLEPHKLANSTFALGTIAIASLSGISVWGINFIDHNLESSLVNIAIAIVAAMVIAVAQLGAVAIAKIDPQAKVQGGILAIGIPIFLVAASGFIWGKGEAVDIAGMTAIAELLIFTYFWWQIPSLQAKNIQFKFSILFVAIALGTTLGLKLI